MQALVDHLREDPSDPHRWRICVDYLLEHAPSIQDPAALDVLEAALLDQRVAEEPAEQPPLGGWVRLHDGQAWLLCGEPEGAWLVRSIALEVLTERIRRRFDATDPIASAALAALGLRGEIDLSGGEVVRWRRVVEVVSDPVLEYTIAQARALDAASEVGDELGERCVLEGQLVALSLVVSLSQARPLPIIASPEPEEELAWLLAWEANRTGRSPSALLRQIGSQLCVHSPHDYAQSASLIVDGAGELRLVLPVQAVAEAPGQGQCLASEVGVEAGSWVGFDRGPLSPSMAEALVQNILSRLRWEDEDGVALVLPPLRAEVALEMLRQISALAGAPHLVRRATGRARWFDDFRLVSRFTALSTEAQVRVLLEVLRSGIWQLEPGWRADLLEVHAALERYALDGLSPRPLFAGEVFPGAMEPLFGDLWGGRLLSFLMVLGDRIAALGGHPPVSPLWTQDEPSIQCVTSWIALCDEAEIERLLG